jgi:hypothetical protein
MVEPVEPTDPNFSEQDVVEHIETYGVDLLPPLELPMETVRAQSFFTELRTRWPTLYQSLTIGPQFVISTMLEFGNDTKVGFPTVIVNPRGPIFMFPRRMAVVRGEEPSNLQDIETSEVFIGAFDLFGKTFPRQALRLGVVRKVVFATGQTDCTAWLGRNVLEFDAGRLEGVQCLLNYQDDDFNYRIQMETAQITQHMAVPALGGQVVPAGPEQFALVVNLDVNNRLAHPLDADELRGVIERANGLWPGGLLQFLNERRLP